MTQRKSGLDRGVDLNRVLESPRLAAFARI